MKLSQEQLEKMNKTVQDYCEDMGCADCEIKEPCRECLGDFRGNEERMSKAYNIICCYENEETDNVNHPAHYTAGGVECIDALKAATVNLTGIEAVCTANAIKYLWRWKHKNGVEDLKKAKWYIDRLIDECSLANGR